MNIEQTLKRAETLSQSGRLPDALQLLKKLNQTNPNNTRVLLELGVAQRLVGALADSERNLLRAIEISATADAYKALADTQDAMGKTTAAMAGYTKAIELRPNFFQAHANYANLLEESDPDRALRHFQTALTLRPDIAELHDSVGRLLAILGKNTMAQAAFRQAIKLKPTLGTAHFNLANRLVAAGQVDNAITYLRKAVQHMPNPLFAHINLAEALLRNGETEEAHQIVEQLKKSGLAPPQAVEYLEAEFAYATHQFDEAIRRYRSLEAKCVDNDKELRRIYVRKAEIMDAKGEHFSAFEFLERAHQIAVKTFDRDQLKSRVENLLELYPEPLDMLGHSTESVKQPIPVFIFGMSRAGKSIAETLLKSHPTCFGLDEQHSISRATIGSISGRQRASWDATMAKLSPDELGVLAQNYQDIAEEYLEDEGLSIDHGITHVISATPENTWNLALIHRMFPHAPIIRVERDPLDNCLACFFKDYANEHHSYSDRIDDLGFYYLQHQRLVSHWRDVVRIPMLEIRYEDMVTYPNDTRDRLFEYAGLYRTTNGDDFSTRLSPQHVGIWRNYETQLTPLISMLRAEGILRSHR